MRQQFLQEGKHRDDSRVFQYFLFPVTCNLFVRHYRADFFAADDAHDVARHIEIENVYRQIALAA